MLVVIAWVESGRTALVLAGDWHQIPHGPPRARDYVALGDQKAKTWCLLSPLSVPSINRYISKPWRRFRESSMVNSDSLHDELYHAATVICAPYSNRTYIESNPLVTDPD
jgi:hypothetical protein